MKRDKDFEEVLPRRPFRARRGERDGDAFFDPAPLAVAIRTKLLPATLETLRCWDLPSRRLGHGARCDGISPRRRNGS